MCNKNAYYKSDIIFTHYFSFQYLLSYIKSHIYESVLVYFSVLLTQTTTVDIHYRGLMLSMFITNVHTTQYKITVFTITMNITVKVS